MDLRWHPHFYFAKKDRGEVKTAELLPATAFYNTEILALAKAPLYLYISVCFDVKLSLATIIQMITVRVRRFGFKKMFRFLAK
jgi:hypothetical protein